MTSELRLPSLKPPLSFLAASLKLLAPLFLIASLICQHGAPWLPLGSFDSGLPAQKGMFSRLLEVSIPERMLSVEA